jgi:GAF domain-containing protein
MDSPSTESILAPTLAEVTSAVAHGTPLAQILGIIVRDCVELFSADEAAVLLAPPDGSVQLVAASSSADDLTELLTLSGTSGPSLASVRSGRAVFNEDVRVFSHGYVEFAERAVRLGYRSIHVFPLRVQDTILGAFPVLSRRTGFLSIQEAVGVKTLADFAAIAVLSRPETPDEESLSLRLHQAIDERVIVGQALGVIVQQRGIRPEVAFGEMLETARSSGCQVREVAEQIVRDALKTV